MRRALPFVVALGLLAAVGNAPVKPDFGLRVGNAWTYSVKSDQGESTYTESAVRYVDVKDGKALEIKVAYPKGYTSYRYLGQDENGLLSYYNSEMNGPGVSADMKPAVLVRMPFNKGLTWKWVEPWRGQTAGEVDERELRKLDSNESAVIVAEDEEVTVPAGKYKAVHVRITSECEARGRTFTDHWYVFGVGLVKTVVAAHEGSFERVLTKFVPGS